MISSKRWIFEKDRYICPVCNLVVDDPDEFEDSRCPRCGFQDEKDKNKKEK